MRLVSLLPIMAAVSSVAMIEASAQTSGQTVASDAGKPSALSESYQDWTVRCASKDGRRECSLSQAQTNANGQRVLVVELRPVDDGSLKGNLILPFGLRLQKGATFAVDELPPGKPATFRTCLPVGCVISLLFTDSITRSLRSGTALKVRAQSSDSDTEVPFSISLKGFNSALERTIALSKH
ncbi:MAG: invasion associated locus B family protein [Alphaproteobacteria bacterium]|nr:MAG: invasion associated locus B family protein [Alphaproteobacteria bacterium]